MLRAISQLDCRVNVAARNLRTGTIGLAVAEADRSYYGRRAPREFVSRCSVESSGG